MACCSAAVAEKQIRSCFLDYDLLDAVIGLAPNLFYGTGIPAGILVLRAPGSKPPEQRGKVLFINADREYYEGRATFIPSTSRRSSAATTFSRMFPASPGSWTGASPPRTTTI
jgi:N-6 DNA Methylase